MTRPAAALLLLVSALSVLSAEPLEDGFRHPPAAAKPHTWWHWCNDNVTREGITKDLTELAQAGVGGAQIFNVAPGGPVGNVKYGSPEWLALIKHAAQEADRLGLDLIMHNGPGWSSSGGAWVKPEHAMQRVVWTERRVTGPANFDETLPAPAKRVDYYRDVAVLAFPTPPAEHPTMAAAAPRITCDAPRFDGAKVLDGDPRTFATLPKPTGAKPAVIDLEFAAPYTARSFTLLLGGQLVDGRPPTDFTRILDDLAVVSRRVADFMDGREPGDPNLRRSLIDLQATIRNIRDFSEKLPK